MTMDSQNTNTIPLVYIVLPMSQKCDKSHSVLSNAEVKTLIYQ